MRSRILEVLDTLPASCETVLAAMGYCGGSWNHIPLSRRVVVPKVDDCITLLLHTDDTPHGNLKKTGHMYFRDCDTGAYSIEGMKEKICRTYGMEFGTSIFGSWFQNYTNADIIDTGVYDCYSEEYVTVIAVPSYSGRVPKLAAERIHKVHGNGSRCCGQAFL